MSLYAAYAISNRHTDFDPLSLWSRMFITVVLADRFGYLNKFSNWDLAADPNMPRPKREFKYDSFSDLLDKRAVEFIEFAGDKPLYVHWSGGVDSTALLVSVLKHIDDPSRVTVVFTDAAINEYLWFYTNILEKSGVNFLKLNPDTTLLADLYSENPNGVYTHGWGGDQLFGSNINQSRPQLAFTNWEDAFKSFWMDEKTFAVHPSKEQRSKAIEVYKQYFDKMDVEINTFSEFAWLGNFCLKNSFLYHFMPMHTNIVEVRESMFPFFFDSDMQDWALANYKENCSYHQKYDLLNYKKQMKDYIVDYTKDESYRYKSKVGSWQNSFDSSMEKGRFALVDSDVGYRIWKVNSRFDCNTCHRTVRELRPILEEYAKNEAVFASYSA